MLTQYVRISTRELIAHPGLLEPGSISTWRFPGGLTVTVEAFPHSVRLTAGQVHTVVSLRHVPLPYGGHRVWLVCPHCCASRGMMFLGSLTWACRKCLHLVYPSSREDRHGRLGRKLEKRLRLLGSGWTLDFERIPKKPRQRWRTYWRLREEIAALESARALELLSACVPNLVARSPRALRSR